MKKLLVLGLLVLLGGVAAYPVLGALRGLRDARQLGAHAKWTAARARLEDYLWLRPHDERALLLMAEALVKDDQLETPSAVDEALECLARVPDSSPLAASARTQEGRLLLLLARRPEAAELALRRALELDGSLAEAWYLLWKVYDLTGRVEDAEPVFWELYDRTPDTEQTLRLREWYMSQFYTTTANPAMDQMLGVIGEDERPSRLSEHRRYLMFREAEPESPVPYAALARWYHTEKDFKFALEVLGQAKGHVPESRLDHPFYLAVLIVTLIDLGEFDQAETALGRWPEPREGFEYWRCRALVLDEALGKYEEAIAAYDQALRIWSGPADWGLRHRKANCLARLGRHEEAEEVRADAGRVVALMHTDVHRGLREALAHLSDGPRLMQIAEYYRNLGRAREASSWLQHIWRLQPAELPARQDAATTSSSP